MYETLRSQAARDEDPLRLTTGCLAIGYSAGGDTYLLDTRTDGLPVRCLSHKTLEIEPEYQSFESFVAEWLDAPGWVRAEAEAIAAKAGAEHPARMRRVLRIILPCSLPFVASLLFLAVIVWFNG